MLDLGGTFQSFIDSLFGFINSLLQTVFGSLSTFFDNLTIV